MKEENTKTEAAAVMKQEEKAAADRGMAKKAEEEPKNIEPAGGTVLSHQLIREIAAAYEYNSLSPLFALHMTQQNGKKANTPLKAKLLNAILKPSKAFYLTAIRGDSIYQKILLVGDSICCRWEDQDGSVIVAQEKTARNFIKDIIGDISATISDSQKSIIVFTRGQIVALKGIYSLCQAISQMKVKPIFTTYDHLKSFLNAGDEIKGQLDDLAAKGMVKLTGTDNSIITLELRGEEVYRVLEDYDAFYTMQVLTEGRDDFSSLYLIAEGGRLHMMSNPGNGDEIIMRGIDTAGLRSLLNWSWTSAASA
ncbi:MAG: hypothetical protein ACYDGO_02945 [Smithellaceae bacterium]